jgi:hypothetical protein
MILEPGRKNIKEETKVLNIDGKFTNNSQTNKNAFISSQQMRNSV